MTLQNARKIGMTHGSMYPPGFSETRIAKATFDVSSLPPLLRTIVVADGTITKLLEAFLWEPIEVCLISQTVGVDESGLGEDGEKIVRREIILRSRTSGKVCAFASSLILLDRLEPDLQHALMVGEKGIGALLRERRLETYRELLAVEGRQADDSAAALEIDSDSGVVERTYRIHRNQRPLMEITEIFPIDIYR